VQMIPAAYLLVAAIADRPAPSLWSAQVASRVFRSFNVGALLFSFWNWRCRACGKSLWTATLWTKRCRKCGALLRD
jgi:hypothetical protein